MTLPAGGNLPPISLADINGEFGYGTNLAAYQGRVIGTPGGGVKAFNSGAETKLSDFYGTNKVASGGSATLTSGTSYTIPQYRTLRITVTAAGGGGAGGSGASSGGCTGDQGAGGISASNSSFGNSGDAYYVLCNGGGGGSGNGSAGTTYNGNSGNGANGGAGGAGYAGLGNGGAGGAGAKTVTSYFFNPSLSGGTGPTSAGSVPMSIGPIGFAGNGGAGKTLVQFVGCAASGLNGNAGSNGGPASIIIEWTGEP